MNHSNHTNDHDNDGMQNGMQRRKKRRVLARRKRTLDPGIEIDYKNFDMLKRFITDRGKIIPRRISGATQTQQKQISAAVKRARFLSLIPYSVAHSTERGFAGEMQMAAQTFSTSARSKPPYPRSSDRGDYRGGDRGDRGGSGDREFRGERNDRGGDFRSEPRGDFKKSRD